MAQSSKFEPKTHPLDSDRIEFLEFLRSEKRLTQSTVQLYERELDMLFEFLKSPEDLEGLRSHLAPLAAATVVRKLIIWKSFLERCKSPWNTALAKMKLPKVRQKQPKFLTDEEAFRLEHVCYKSNMLNRDRLLVCLMLQLGLRLSEVLNLRFSDFEGDWIRIVRKGEKEQRLPLSPALRTFIDAHRNEQNPQSNHFVFEGRTSENLTSRGVQNIIEKLRIAAQIDKKITPHSLRHTFASSLAAKGASLAALKEILGHQKISTTERYLHVTPDHLRETLGLLK